MRRQRLTWLMHEIIVDTTGACMAPDYGNVGLRPNSQRRTPQLRKHADDPLRRASRPSWAGEGVGGFRAALFRLRPFECPLSGGRAVQHHQRDDGGLRVAIKAVAWRRTKYLASHVVRPSLGRAGLSIAGHIGRRGSRSPLYGRPSGQGTGTARPADMGSPSPQGPGALRAWRRLAVAMLEEQQRVSACRPCERARGSGPCVQSP
jgi:hypothetical protein